MHHYTHACTDVHAGSTCMHVSPNRHIRTDLRVGLKHSQGRCDPLIVGVVFERIPRLGQSGQRWQCLPVVLQVLGAERDELIWCGAALLMCDTPPAAIVLID